MFNNIKVKVEPGEGEKKAGQGKFKPTIPIKKKDEIVAAVDNTTTTTTTVKTENITSSFTNTQQQQKQQQQQQQKQQHQQHQSKKRELTNKSHELKGQNRQKWVMPIGQSFFMSQKDSIANKKTKSNTTNSNANANANDNANSNSNSNANNQDKVLPFVISNIQLKSGNQLIQPLSNNNVNPMGIRRIIDDDNDDDDDINNRMLIDQMNNKGSYSFGPYNEDDDLIDTDSGTESSSDSDDDMDIKADAEEIWPPQKYDLLEPLSLPLGPITDTKRDELERQAIIYHPNDIEALEREKSDIFLLQFPSDLCLKSNINPIEVNEDKDDDMKLLDTNDDKSLKEAKKVYITY